MGTVTLNLEAKIMSVLKNRNKVGNRVLFSWKTLGLFLVLLAVATAVMGCYSENLYELELQHRVDPHSSDRGKWQF